MTSLVESLLLHTGIPGRVGTPTRKVLNNHEEQLRERGVSLERVELDGTGCLQLTGPSKGSPTGPRRPRSTIVSSPNLLGSRRIGSEDVKFFRPEAATLIGQVVRSLKPRRTSVVIEVLAAPFVLQLAYERDLKQGETAPPEEFFDLDLPLVDLRALRNRIMNVDTVEEVTFLPLCPNDRPSPTQVFECLPGKTRRPGSARIFRRRTTASTPSLDLPQPKRLNSSVKGLLWTPRSIRASLAANHVLDGNKLSRAGLHEFVRDTLTDKPDQRLGIWTIEQFQTILAAHSEVDLGLFTEQRDRLQG